jgi:hypothetical protein
MTRIKKAPNQMSVDDLLAELENTQAVKDEQLSEEIDVTAYKNDIISFLSIFKILPGEHKVRKSVMYSLYRSWSENPMPPSSFTVQFASLIPSEVKTTKHFHINQTAIKITYDAFKLRDSMVNKTKSKKWAERFQGFLNHYRIEKGDHWIEEPLLLELHERYMVMKQGKITISTAQTSNFLKIYFKHKQTKDGLIYSVNKQVMDNFTKKEAKKILDNYEKKAVKKKQAKAS